LEEVIADEEVEELKRERRDPLEPMEIHL